ncbi:response regulator transcription factor [Cryomorpha ignava]|uniref:Response regulator transcription factor n=1 Tax=Cryomorpha ignava TaxID=101383 RepID=A0A7K3WKI3_9FLAO|nr:response regulator [Cryomorpha ignava]NEN22160.1 response regulator transcription factor [Cryomorpha ignava]
MADKPVKILVVEDEMIIAAKISMYLIEMGYEVTGIIPRSEEVLNHLELNDPDIVLLDIQLKGDMDGVELAALLIKEHPIPVIFLTANADEETFQRAKDTKPYAFLTKPFKKIDLKRTLELTISRMAENTVDAIEVNEPDGTPLTDRIFVLHKDRKVKIMLETILYIEAERNYCNIVTTDGNYLLTMPMKNLEMSLPSSSFQRIHRSHIVNINHVDELDEGTIVVGGKLLGLSKTYRKEFLRRINSV